MFTQATENFNKINNESAQAVRQSTELAQKSSQKLLEMQSAWFSQAIKFGADQAQLLSKAQEPAVYFSEQASLVGEFLELSAKNGQDFVATVTENSAEARTLVEQNVEQAQVTLRAVAEEVTAVAKPATKRAAKSATKKKAA